MEEWKIVEEVPIYEVSNTGIVRHRKTLHPIKAKMAGLGYLQVKLWNGEKHLTRQVHLLVAKAFIGECPTRHEAHHKDGSRDNNKANNIEYISHRDNIIAKYRTGGIKRSNMSRRSIDESTARSIKVALHAGDKTVSDIAYIFNVTTAVVYGIKSGSSWSWM